MNELDAFQRAADCRSGGAAARGAARRRRRLRAAEAARRRARFRRPAAARARPAGRATRASARRFRRASRTSSSTSSRTPIRCRPRSCCCSRPTIRRKRDWRRVTPVPGKLFIVGDPKQSIYRFRRADVETYREVCELLESRGAQAAFLHTSFRATPAIQRAVNAAFAPLMTGDRADAAGRVRRRCRRIAPDSPDAAVGRRAAGARAVRHSGASPATPSRSRCPTPSARSSTGWCTESGWTVTERTTRDELPIAVPIQPRHVCILFRRFLHFGDDVTRPYVEALEARGVPHLLVGGKSFHEREEVETMRAALAAIEWPDDELSVFATLRGALFAHRRRDAARVPPSRTSVFHPFRVPDDAVAGAAAGGRRAAAAAAAAPPAATTGRSPTRSRSC